MELYLSHTGFNTSNNTISNTTDNTGNNTTGNTTDAVLRPYPNVAQIVMMWTLPVLMVTLNISVFVVVPRMETVQSGTGLGMLSLAAADFSLGCIHLLRMSYNTYIGTVKEKKIVTL